MAIAVLSMTTGLPLAIGAPPLFAAWLLGHGELTVTRVSTRRKRGHPAVVGFEVTQACSYCASLSRRKRLRRVSLAVEQRETALRVHLAPSRQPFGRYLRVV